MKGVLSKKRFLLIFCLFLLMPAAAVYNNQTAVGKDVIIFDNKLPHVEIRRPNSDDELKPEFEVEIYAEDNMGISAVELYVDGEKHYTFNDVNSMPLRKRLHLEPGHYSLRAKAVDNSGNEEWSSRKRIRVKNYDDIPPVTGVYFEGKRLSSGVFDSMVEVTLKARDNINGSGIRNIFFRIGEKAHYIKYKGTFTINKKGKNKLFYYAVDNNGNYERQQMTEVYIDDSWNDDSDYPDSPQYPEYPEYPDDDYGYSDYPAYEIGEYSLICEELKAQGQVKMHRVFTNGRVDLDGNIKADYLATSSRIIEEKGHVKINKLRTDIYYRQIPVPDWTALINRTRRRYDRELDNPSEMSNVRFERNLIIDNAKNISGLLVVNGDLTLRGQTNLSNTGIFVTGRVNITGNTKINGFIYAGEGISLRDQLHVNGLVISRGRAQVEGNVILRHAGVNWFLRYMR